MEWQYIKYGRNLGGEVVGEEGRSKQNDGILFFIARTGMEDWENNIYFVCVSPFGLQPKWGNLGARKSEMQT